MTPPLSDIEGLNARWKSTWMGGTLEKLRIRSSLMLKSSLDAAPSSLA